MDGIKRILATPFQGVGSATAAGAVDGAIHRLADAPVLDYAQAELDNLIRQAIEGFNADSFQALSTFFTQRRDELEEEQRNGLGRLIDNISNSRQDPLRSRALLIAFQSENQNPSSVIVAKTEQVVKEAICSLFGTILPFLKGNDNTYVRAGTALSRWKGGSPLEEITPEIIAAFKQSIFSSQPTPAMELDRLLTAAILELNDETLEAVQGFNLASLPEMQRNIIQDLLGNISRKDEGLLIKLIDAQQSLSRNGPPSFIATHGLEVVKQTFLRSTDMILGILRPRLPEEVYGRLYQVLSKYKLKECNSPASLKGTIQEMLDVFEAREDIVIRVQGVDVLAVIRGLIKTENEAFYDCDASQDAAPVNLTDDLACRRAGFMESLRRMLAEDEGRSSPQVSSAEQLQQEMKIEKEEFVSNTVLLLCFKLACNICLYEEERPRNDIQLVVHAKQQNRVSPMEFLQSNLLRILATSETRLRRVRTIQARIVWWLLAWIVPFLTTNLLNHAFNVINRCISSPHPFDPIIELFNCYFSTLTPIYRKLSSGGDGTDHLEGQLARRLEEQLYKNNLTRRQLYKAFLSHVMQASLGSSIPARITSFVVTKLFALPFYWAASATMRLVDRTFTSSHNGYSVGISRILRQQLIKLKEDLAQPFPSKSKPEPLMPSQDSKQVAACLEGFLYTMHFYKASSIQSARMPYLAEGIALNEAVNVATPLIQQVIADLGKGDRIGQLALELLRNANRALYDPSSSKESEAEQTVVHQDVNKLVWEVFGVYQQRFVRDLDVSGKHRLELFLKLFQDIKIQTESVVAFVRELLDQIRYREDAVEVTEKAITSMMRVVGTMSALKDLSKQPLIESDALRLKKMASVITEWEAQLQLHLRSMLEVIAQIKKSKDLSDLNTLLEQCKDGLNGPSDRMNLICQSDWWTSLGRRLGEHNIVVVPRDLDQTLNHCQTFQRNKKYQEILQGTLVTLHQNGYMPALNLLLGEVPLVDYRRRRHYQGMGAVLAATPAEDIVQQASPAARFGYIHRVFNDVRRRFVRAPITRRDQETCKSSIENELRKKLDASTVENKRIAEDHLFPFVFSLKDEVIRNLSVLPEPNELFKERYTSLQKTLDELSNYISSQKVPVVHNYEVVDDANVMQIAHGIYQLPSAVITEALKGLQNWLSHPKTFPRIVDHAVQVFVTSKT